MDNKTVPGQEFQNNGTYSNNDFQNGFSSSSKKTIIEGQEETSSRENPKNLNVLVGFLVTFSKTEIGEYWELREGNNSIGSSAENSIELSEKHVSGKHANLNVSKDASNNSWKFQIVDLSSSNGTELNGSRLPIYSGVELTNNDRIKIGEYTLVLIAADKFVMNLFKSDKFQGTTQNISYDSRDYFSSNDNSTRASY